MRRPTGDEPFFVKVCMWFNCFLPYLILACLLGALHAACSKLP
jgi:hypothetical protein